jgi:predicted flap endonuclease-1-like 5' DNA nuclease
MKFLNIFLQITNFDNPAKPDATWQALLLLLIALAIGVIIGWLYWRRGSVAATTEDPRLADLQSRNTKLQNDFARLQTQYNSALGEIETHKTKTASLSTGVNLRSGELETELADVKAKLKICNDNTSLKDQEMADLKARLATPPVNTGLDKELADLKSKLTGYEGDLTQRNRELATLKQELENERNKADAAPAMMMMSAPVDTGRMAVLEDELTALKKDNDRLRDELAHSQPILPDNRELTPQEFETEKQKLLASVGIATLTDRDDLKIVLGIGPFIEEKLHSVGIYTFKQISAFKEDDILRTQKLIKFFPGRIEREKWIPQSRDLYERKMKGEKLVYVEPAEFELTPAQYEEEKTKLLASIGSAEGKQDNLKDVVGIGPVLEKRLHEIGIFTFLQISKFSEEDIKRVNKLLKTFAGRIEREKWVPQSKDFVVRQTQV